MMNFEFLKGQKGFRLLARFTSDAEMFAVSHPDMSAISARKSLEWLVKTFYVKKYGKCREATLFDLIQDTRFSAYIDDTTISCIHLVRQIGNNAAHGERIKKSEAIKALEALYYTVREVMRFFGESGTYPDFNKEAYSPVVERPVINLADLQTPEIKEEIKVEEIKALASDIPAISTELKKTEKPSIDFTEAETRKIFIDQALKEAGWNVFHAEGAIKSGMACVEIKLEGMPNDSGIGYADYVLFDDDNRPLAVVEAKRTCKDEEEGRVQAIRYADCMERIWGVRPVIFYTNGYVIKMIDGTGAPSRRVFGYYTKQELHSLIIRRDLRKISDTRIDENISDRYFIQHATTAVCEAFNAFHRKALVIMATGTGKTRCAISIVDVLQRAHWVNNILFLADRKELVRQAKNAFKKYLPDYTISAFSEENDDDRDYNARIVLSTHKTMLNLIDGEEKKFGIGRFDLVIIDECHRSVYNRYKAIFNYFDSMTLGLTATPREQVEDDTYKLFDMEKGKPTYSYDYQTAVSEDFLVNYHLLDKTTNLLKNGLKYDDLSDKEKEEYETIFVDEEGNFPKQINREEFMRNVMNNATIDLVLETLMNEGLKIKSGEQLGKTIIFAVKHDHAQKIVERFNFLYPELAGKGFCELIDYQADKYVQTLIDDFKNPDKMPIIAVSVDMLDTGVDIPEITNLVFFKRVFSVIKFWQMIGRGTRTCKNLNVFSPSKPFFKLEDEDGSLARHDDKQGFYIFDFCDNFDFFKENEDGRKVGTGLSLSQRIFNLKLEMIFELQKLEHQGNEEHKAYYEKWREECFSIVKGFNRNHINVRYHLKHVEKYSQAEAWNYLSLIELKELKQFITPLVSSEDGIEDAKSFDAWLFNMELTEIIGEDDYSKAIQKVTNACEKLLEKTTIPRIKEKVGFIKEVLTGEFWKTKSVSKLEKIRTELRDIIHYAKEEAKPMVETNFDDMVILKEGKQLIPQFKNYKRRVLDYLADNIDHPVIQKIRHIEKLDDKDLKELEHILWGELGTQADYDETFKGEPIAAFVRRTVGLENEAVNKMLAKYLQLYEFNPMQMEFLHQIVNYVRQNGDIVPNNLVLNDPFKNVEYLELFEEKTGVVYEIIKALHNAICIIA